MFELFVTAGCSVQTAITELKRLAEDSPDGAGAIAAGTRLT
jgi:hypothetical protein